MHDPDPSGDEPTRTGQAPGPDPWQRRYREPVEAERPSPDRPRPEPRPPEPTLWRPWLSQPSPADTTVAPSPAPPVERAEPPADMTVEVPAVAPAPPPPEPAGPPAANSPLTPTPAVSRGEGRGRGRRRAVTKPRSPWRSTLEWVGVVVLALGAAFLVKTFVLQTFFIPSASMEQTLLPGDRVFVNKLAYDFHPIHRGDIVVFTLPPGETAGPGIDDLIKRVIGLPGDTIEAIGGRVYVNGKALDEPYLPPGAVTTLLPRQKVPAGRYFLMGDNRTDSRDSRYFGTIPGSDIVGRAFIRIWPLSRIGLL